MKKNLAAGSFSRQRLACAYFFASCGLSYGIFTSRMPALKNLVNASDGQIGFLLLAFGGFSFCGLLSSKFIIERAGARIITGAAPLVFMSALTIGSLAFSYWQLVGFCVIAGLATGLCDVAMNAQGMMIEKRHNVLCMASLHACFSMGGVFGALTGSFFAALNLSPFWNFLIICGCYLLFWRWAFANSIAGETKKAATRQKARHRIPLLIYFYGLMSMLCYVSEGSVGEWGSVLLHTVKDASQQEAALAFAVFSVPMVICRFLTDKLRGIIKDFYIVFGGSLLSTMAMALVLISSRPILCLAGYFAMGIGFAPIVPLLYSRAGKTPGISAGQASSSMSLLSYTGLLFFPPFLGMLGDSIGLNNALWVITGCCACIVCGSIVFARMRADPGASAKIG